MLRIKAHAKINLTLDVVGRRPDGYHELRTIMHEIPLCDELTLDFDAEGLSCTSNLPYIKDGSNLALRAAKSFYEHTGIEEGLNISIEKRTPVGAGLGGGSADAAAVLNALNSRHGEPLSKEELLAVGAELGADVPFCMIGGCALCEGIGEKMTPLPTLPRCHMVLVKPSVSLSTADMFARLDRQGRNTLHPDTEACIAALRSGDLVGLAKRMFNSMESAAVRVAEIGEVKNELLRMGALGACMSGSGSSVVGLFCDRDIAEKAADGCRGYRREVFLLDI